MHAFRLLISALGAAGVTDPACVPDTSGDWPYANQPPGFFAASNLICSPSDEQDEPKTCSAQSTTSNAGCDLADNAPYCMSQQTTCASDKDGHGPIEQGYACPHLMLGTNAMLKAQQSWAQRVGTLEVDGGRRLNTSNLDFAIFTFDTFTCGQCALIEPDPAHADAFPRAKPLVAQIFNSVAACADVYMAAGGFGVFNGCTNGEPAHTDLYNQIEGNGVTYRWPVYSPGDYADNDAFLAHQCAANAHYFGADANAATAEAECSAATLAHTLYWGGGLRGGRSVTECAEHGALSYAECIEKHAPGNGCVLESCLTNASACDLAFPGSDATAQYSRQSCRFAYEHDLHANRDVKITLLKAEQCPRELMDLTGMHVKSYKYADKKGPPVAAEPHYPWIVYSLHEGDRKCSDGGVHTTTMQDCALPSCGRLSASRTLGEGLDVEMEPLFETLYVCKVRTDPNPNPCPNPDPNPDP